MYDVTIIGCGPGGYAAAIRTAQLGGKAAIVEAGDIGGTCVNRGCIPSKVWLKAASMLKMIEGGKEFGIDALVKKVDYKAIVERKSTVAGEIAMGMQALLQANGVQLIQGKGVIKNAREVNVDGQTIGAKNIILSTGSSLDIPEIDGLEAALMTTDQVFDMSKAPKSILVWGNGGHIDVEMASLMNMLGSTVYLATENSRILSKEDHDTSQRLAQAFREQGIEIITRAKLEAVKKSKKVFKAVLAGNKEQTVEVEKIVVSSRKPNTSGLGLKQAGVRLSADGSIAVDDYLKTSVDGIYAVGDITGGWMNSHAASAMGVTAAENVMGQSGKFAFDLIPRGTWTFPQTGSVGLTEEEAEKQDLDVEVGDFPYPINGLAMCYGEVDGAVKVVMEAESQEILGVHIVGTNATELIGEGVMALQLELTADELAHTIRMHPTFSEGIMDSGRDASGWALYLPPKA